MCRRIFQVTKNAMQMRTGQTGEVVEILCGEIGRISHTRGCGSMWASTPTSLKISEGVPNFIRQIFNGRTRNDSHHSSCAQETRFDGRPSGRSLTAGVTIARKRLRLVFSRVSAISASCASFLHTFFWQDRKKYARGATVAVSPQKRNLR